jgi:hypothetical protein
VWEEIEAELSLQIGQLKIYSWSDPNEITNASIAMKQAQADKTLATMSVVRQCALLELSRSTFN